MPVFDYKGLTRAGKNIRGAIDAENIRSARVRLKKDGIFVVELTDKKRVTDSNQRKKGVISNVKVNIKDMALMTRQLATLIRANIPLVDALGAVSEQVEVPALAEAISDCKNMVNEGAPLHKSLAKYPRMFNNIYVSMVEAGEMSGTLEVILMRLAEFNEAQNELRVKVKGALTYPAIMLVATMGLLGFLFTYLVPKMQEIFDSDPELTMPWYTSMVFSISGILVNYWYIFIVGGGLIYFFFINWKSTVAGRAQWDAISLRIPIFGEVTRLVAVARFTRTLSTLLNGGVPMLTSLQIVRNVVDNAVIAQAIDEARSNISEGEGISGPLKKSGQFPAIVVHMVSIGEKTGELENMLIQVADAFDFQVKAKIDAMTSLINPLILIIMGGTIALIIFSVMMPMFEMTSRLG
jgi:general secretion pathway protein F